MTDSNKVYRGALISVVATVAFCAGAVATLAPPTAEIGSMGRAAFKADDNISRSLEKIISSGSSPEIAEAAIKNAQGLMDKTHEEFNRQCNAYLDETWNPMAFMFRKACSERFFPLTEKTIERYKVSQAILGR